MKQREREKRNTLKVYLFHCIESFLARVMINIKGGERRRILYNLVNISPHLAFSVGNSWPCICCLALSLSPSIFLSLSVCVPHQLSSDRSNANEGESEDERKRSSGSSRGNRGTLDQCVNHFVTRVIVRRKRERVEVKVQAKNVRERKNEKCKLRMKKLRVQLVISLQLIG